MTFGMRGKIGAKSLGLFTYEKSFDEAGVQATCEVRVFPLLVKRQSEAWPEFDQRIVQWVEPSKALSLIKEPDLKKLVAAFVKRAAAAANKSVP